MTRKVFFIFIALIIPMAVPAKSPVASRIVLEGYSGMHELAERLGKKFMKTHTDAKIAVRTYGTSEGFEAFMSGQADIWMTRRDPKKKEKKALKMVKFEKITLGRLPMAIIVNSKNPIERLTLHQMREIFTGEIQNWRVFGGSDQTILVAAPYRKDSGYRFFKKEFLDKKHVVNSQIPLTSTDSIEDFVRTHEESISFVDYSEQLEKAKGIKILAVEKSKPGKNLFRSSQSREYPLVNSLHFYFRSKNRAKLSEFLNFVESKESKAMVERSLLASRSPVEFPRSRISNYTNIPIPEVSGMAWRPSMTKGQTEIVAIGDQKFDVAIGSWNSQLGSLKFKKHDVRSLFDIKKDQDSEWEAVAADGKRRLFLMTEAGTVTVLDAKLENILQTIKLLTPDIKSTQANSGVEGLILSRNGRIFVVKEKRPLRLIEYGPKGAKPLGLGTQDIVMPFVEFPLSKNKQIDYMALKSWKLSSRDELEWADISEASSSPSGELYLLSQIDHRIVRVKLPLKPTDLEFRITSAWWIPIGGAEGMVIAIDRRPLVAIDDKNLHNNLYQLEPLLNQSQQ